MSNRAYTGAAWREVALADGRRGIWVRYNQGALELCGGREGDDVLVRLCPPATGCHRLTEAELEDLRALIAAYDWAKDGNRQIRHFTSASSRVVIRPQAFDKREE